MMNRSSIFAGLAALAIACTGAATGWTAAAAATSPWTVQNAVPQVRQGSFSGTSCPTASVCVAVGSHVETGATGSVDHVLAEELTSGAWHLTTTPTPAGATISHFTAVDCTSSSACIAVGDYTTGGAKRALAEKWNGSAWSVLSVPLPSATKGTGLAGVSCPSATSCIAVGYRQPTSGKQVPFSAKWNGTAWTLPTTPAPKPQSNLAAVSCFSASSCVAVGGALGVGQSIAERWNGSAWSALATVDPNPQDTLSGISCTSATACTAIGTSDGDAVDTQAYSAALSGSTWTIDTSLDSPGDDGSSGAAISCPSTGVCYAAGFGVDETDSFSAYEPTTWKLSGGQWTLDPTIALQSDQEPLAGISCPSATACTAVGTLTDAVSEPHSLAVAITGSGSTVKQLVTADPTGPESGELDSVSCPTSTTCFAAGGFGVSAAGAERLQNGTWTVQTLGAIDFDQDAELDGISCPTTSFCMAIGNGFGSDDDTGTLFYEKWNGSAWATGLMVQPSGDFNDIDSISCLSASSCVAVGSSDASGNALIETWNGSSWKQVSVSTPAVGSLLDSVSCVSTTRCVAVGYTFNSADTYQEPFIESLNGSTWTSTTLNEQGALSAVSCASSTACAAVGDNGDAPLIEQLSGTTWKAATSPIQSASLNAVSCFSATSCTAVGATGAATNPTRVIRLSGGAWTQVAAPATIPNSTLFGVDCSSATACHVVGRANDTPFAAVSS